MSFVELLLYIVGFLVSVFGGVLFVEFVLSFFPDFFDGEESVDEDVRGIEHAGKTIGIFERVIVTMLIFLYAYNAISFVIVAKSLARFNQLKRRKFAEYYLIGTFSSLAFSILIGVIVLKLAAVS